MMNYQESSKCYGDPMRGDEIPAVAFLKELAGSGPALELGIGAGRIALPLAASGLQVDGVDISPKTVALMRKKPKGKNVSVVMGDFADVPVRGKYRLIYVIWNTFFNLATQDSQVRCFQNVAAHLTDDGVFVVEAYMPSFLYRLRKDQYVDAESIEVDEVCLDLLRHNAATQIIEENHVCLSRTGVSFGPVVQRYAWPSELDLMARMAGLCLKQRWGTWGRESFKSNSEAHISVYGRAAEMEKDERPTKESRRRGVPRA
jgi:SAM-dependent methyltransferase